MYIVELYEDRKKVCPVIVFLDQLPVKIRAKAAKWMDILGREGPNLSRPYADIVRGKIRELRVDFGSNAYRFLYFFYSKNIIITHGFIKKTDEVPEGEILKAQRYMEDFLKRNIGG